MPHDPQSLLYKLLNNRRGNKSLTLIKSAYGTKQGRTVNTTEEQNKVQNDLDNGAINMKFNRDKCKTLHLGKSKMHSYRADTWLGQNTFAKDLGTVANHKVKMSQQCDATVKKKKKKFYAILGCINGTIVSKSQVPFLFSTTQISSGVQFWCPHIRKIGESSKEGQ